MIDMKVCLIAPEFLPNWGGVGTYCVELARALAEKVELHVVTLERKENGKPVYSRRDMIDFFNDKVEIHILTESLMKDTFFYNAKMQYAVYRRLPKILKEYDIDLIHTNFPHMPDILFKLGKRGNVNCVTTVHTTIEGQRGGTKASHLNFSQMELSEKSTLLMYPMLRFAENLYLRRSRNLMTVSNWMKEIIRKSYPFVPDLFVVHNGVDTKKFSPRRQDFESEEKGSVPVVLFSSRLTAAKGVHYLIRAIPEILKRNREVHFVFAGAGQKDMWIDMLKEMKVDSKFYTFLGYVDYKQLPKLYAQSDIFAAPSLYENLPIRILEAMSCGLAVVASNICAIPEAITDNEDGLLFPLGDVTSFVDDLVMLLEDDGLRRRLGREARRTATERFSWDVLTAKILGFYERTLST